MENRGVADMPRTEESVKFEDQQIDINKHVDCQKHLLNKFGEQINFFFRISTFLGTQPTFTQVPPNLPPSITATYKT